MDVEQHDVRYDIFGAFERLASGRDLGDYRMPERTQKLDEQSTRIVIVFRNQNPNA